MHYSAAETCLLRADKIRVLPIARQTENVGQANNAKTDAQNNVAAILEVFPTQYMSGADPDCKPALKHDPSNVMFIRNLACLSAARPHAD